MLWLNGCGEGAPRSRVDGIDWVYVTTEMGRKYLSLFFFVSVTLFLNHSVVSTHTEYVNPEMKKSEPTKEFWSQLICSSKNQEMLQFLW